MIAKKRSIALLCTLLLVLFASSMTNTAAAKYVFEDVVSVTGGSFTKKEWEYSYQINYGQQECELGKVVVGYDTDWINEDYCWVKYTYPSTKCYVSAGVNNGKGWTHTSYQGTFNRWAKEEVRHSSNSPKFRFKFATNSPVGDEWHNFIFLIDPNYNSYEKRSK